MTSSAAIEFAGLRVEFRSAQPAVLELVRSAAAISPAVTGGESAAAPRFEADLSIGTSARWFSRDVGCAEAESPVDGPSFVAVLRAAMAHALAPDGALLHAAGAVIDGRGVLFVAPSEGGKTTISRLLSAGADILSDETICVRPDPARPGRYRIWGTCFWSGPAYPSRAGAFPLSAVFFLRKGSPAVTPLTRPRALRELLGELHLPLLADATENALTFATELVAATPVRALSFALDSDPLPLVRSSLAEPA